MGAFTLSELEGLLTAALEPLRNPRQGAGESALCLASVRLSLSLQPVGSGRLRRYRFADRESLESTTVVTYLFDAGDGILERVEQCGTVPHG